MIDADFVQSIVDLARVQKFDVDGKTFTTEQLHEVKPSLPEQPKHIAVVSLIGFADLIRTAIEKLDKDQFLIHVEDEDTVTLKSKVSDEHGRRLTLIKASPVPFDAFRFGQWQSQEEFIIGVSARFAQTDDKDYVLKIASSLTEDATSISEDNGFSQKAIVKAGMRVPETVVLKPQVELAPYRTFPEIGQPVSKFVFRARGGGSPQLMLVEADGGRWKLGAINEIRRYIATLDLGVTLIA